MENRFYIYAYIRPDINIPFYIGKGCRSRNTSRFGRNKYWKSIVEKCGFIYLFLEKNLTEKQAFEKEKYYIKKYRDEGLKLSNFTDGGDISPWTGKKLSLKHRQAIANGLKSKWRK